jgi:glutamyl/glutaminyl-tRNA synthetase
MKTSILLITTFVTSFWVSGQSIFEQYADNDEVTLVSISPKMFKMLGQMSLSLDDPEAQEYLEMVTSINNFKVLVSSNQQISGDMLKWVNQQVLKQDLDELMSVKDKEADVTFYVKEGKKEDYVEQLLMYVNERVNSSSDTSNFNINGRQINAVLMLLEGNIDLKQNFKIDRSNGFAWRESIEKSTTEKIIIDEKESPLFTYLAHWNYYFFL